MKVINDCCLKDLFLNAEKDVKIWGTVIPCLAAYHALIEMMNINEAKDNDKKKELEKQELEVKRKGYEQEQGEVEEEKKEEEEPRKKELKVQPSNKFSTSMASNFSDH